MYQRNYFRNGQKTNRSIIVKIEVSNGEILDKLSILELKLRFMENEEQKSNVQKERDLLKRASTKILLTNGKTFPEDFYKDLSNVNLKLWSMYRMAWRNEKNVRRARCKL